MSNRNASFSRCTLLALVVAAATKILGQGRPDFEWIVSGPGWDTASAATAADGQFLAIGSTDGSVKIWRTKDGSLVRTLVERDFNPGRIVMLPDASGVIAAGIRFPAETPTIIIWRVSDGARVWSIENAHDYWIMDAAVSPDGQLLATAGYEFQTKLWRLADQSLIRTWTDHAAHFSRPFSRSSSLSRLASLALRPPYWLRQR